MAQAVLAKLGIKLRPREQLSSSRGAEAAGGVVERGEDSPLRPEAGEAEEVQEPDPENEELGEVRAAFKLWQEALDSLLKAEAESSMRKLQLIPLRMKIDRESRHRLLLELGEELIDEMASLPLRRVRAELRGLVCLAQEVEDLGKELGVWLAQWGKPRVEDCHKGHSWSQQASASYQSLGEKLEVAIRLVLPELGKEVGKSA